MQMLLYCMDERASLLYEKGVNSLVGWYEATGNMWTVVPSGIQQFELPFQNLSGIYGFYIYYLHKGDLQFLRNVYKMSRDYVLQYEIGENGLVVHRSGSWDWPDWGKHADIVIMENSWYHIALESCLKMAEVLGMEEDKTEYRNRMDIVRKNIVSNVNENGVFYDFTDNGIPDDRANTLAILAGFAEEKNYSALMELFRNVMNASPYMEKYVLDSMCEMGMVDEAVARMKKRYTEMVEYDYSTLWELWRPTSSLNHAWSGGPLVTMSKYIAGVGVSEPGGLKYTVRPNPGTLNYIECDVPTKLGDLNVRIIRENGKGTVKVSYPKGITVSVIPPVDQVKDGVVEEWHIDLDEKTATN